MLVTGWAKHTNMIDGPMLPDRGHQPNPTMAAIKVDKIVQPCIGIADQRSVVPHSYLFLPPKSMWANMLSENKRTKTCTIQRSDTANQQK